MPGWWATSGERVMQADRKNRVAKARLDLQLRIYDRDKLRRWGLVEREKKTIVANLEAVQKTTGTSKKGMPPNGTRDNAYENSPHSRSRSRLSEKRLMEWKLIERQLQHFLKEKAVVVSTADVRASKGHLAVAWGDDRKPGSSGDAFAWKAEEENAEVQRRVADFLHRGRHAEEATRGKGDEMPMRASPRKSSRSDVRQRHHSERLVRPHTAVRHNEPPLKQTKRPMSAFTPKQSQTFLIMKDVASTVPGKQLLRGSKTDMPSAKVNNFVRELDSEPEPGVFAEERTYAETAVSKSVYSDRDSDDILSESGFNALSKFVSISSGMLNQFNEYGDFIHASQSNTSARSAKCSRVSSQSATRMKIDDEDCTDYKPEVATERITKKKSRIEYPDMHDEPTVNTAVKSAKVFSKGSMKKALQDLVNENNPDKREILRQERLRDIKSRSAKLASATTQFNII